MKGWFARAGIALFFSVFALKGLARTTVCEGVMAGTVKNASALDKTACQIIARAEEGDAEAQYEAGLIYLWGVDSLAQDMAISVQWVEKAAQQGQPEAAYQLGALYVLGEGVKQNMLLARHYFEVAADRGMSMALFELGGMDEFGLGGEMNKDRAKKRYDKARERHYFDAEITPVLNERELAENPWEAAEKGDRLAQYYAGLAKWQEAMNHPAAPNRKDMFKASAQWFRKSAEQGYAPAQVRYGQVFARGSTGELDDEKAAIWFAKSAEQHHAEGQFELAVLYANGLGVKKDEGRALSLFTWAAERDYVPAQKMLATMYETGIGVKVNKAQARQWHRRTAPQSAMAFRVMLRLTDMP